MIFFRRHFLFIYLICTANLSYAQSGNGEIVSRSFELRYISDNDAANGESDFKGSTSVFDTEQRIKYLGHYADYASRFFEDISLKTKAVSSEELSSALANLKPQPLPQVRTKVRLDSWKRYTYREGQYKESLNKISKWNEHPLASISNEHLIIKKSEQPFVIDIPMQSWRFKTEFSMHSQGAYNVIIGNNMQNGCVFGIDEKGLPFFISDKEKIIPILKTPKGSTDKWLVEIDLAEGFRKYNLYLNGNLIADYVPLTDTSCKASDRISISCENVVSIENMRGVGYDPTRMAKNIQRPYDVHTFLDDNFSIKQPVDGWMNAEYDDSLWREEKIPFSHGSERYAGEDIYLRKSVFVEEFQKVYFELESLFPSGELWINGKIVEVIKTSHPQFIDITQYLKPNRENILALKVNSFAASERMVMHHAPTDMNIGWYAGRSALHFTQPTRITDMYVYTRSLDDGKALMSAEVTVHNDSYLFYDGTLSVNMKEWFPIESDNEIIVDSINIKMEPQQRMTYRLNFEVSNPKLWSSSNPDLYSVRALLTNSIHGAIEKNTGLLMVIMQKAVSFTSKS